MNTSVDPRQVEKLRAEYLDLLRILYGTGLTGFKRAKALLDVSFLGMLITQGALFGALFFMEDLNDSAIVAILVIVVLAAFWWFRTVNKELAKHEEVKRIHTENEKLLKEIEREYLALTGTQLRGTFTANEVNKAFEPLLKKHGLKIGS
jgi:hypothetical protein